MADLSDERLGELTTWYSDGSMPDAHGLLLDLQRLRAAQTADRERIVDLIKEAVEEACTRGVKSGHALVTDIATRAADRLVTGVVRLSNEEVHHLHSCPPRT